MTKKSPEYEYNNGDNSVKYKGVRKRKWGKWVSEIRLPNSRERIWLGSYDSPEKAARAFDAAQFCLRGKSANFNFPDNPPDIAGGQSMTPSEIQAAAARFANLTASDHHHHHPTVRDVSEENRMVEEEYYNLSYSPSISDGTTGVETSFHEQLNEFNLSNTLGSGNYENEFGYFTGYDEFTAGHYFSPPQDNFDSGVQEDTYDASLYQHSYLWNF
ncbi:unnamed protein product [Amaranthus hypochondriacus]